MATASGTQRAAEQIAPLVRATLEATLHTAKVLRTATSEDGTRLDLWPSPGRGVRNAPLSTTHCVNLLLALGCGRPVNAAETVQTFRSLQRNKTRETLTEWVVPNRLTSKYDPNYNQRIIETELELYDDNFFGSTFGNALDFLTRILGENEIEDDLRASIEGARVIVTIEPHPMAEIVIYFAGPHSRAVRESYSLAPLQPDLALDGEDVPVTGELQRVFYGVALVALAKVWKGAASAAGRSTSPESGQDQSADENAALPGAASPNSLQPTQPETDHTRQSSLDTCDDTGRVCDPSIGFDLEAGPFPYRSRSHERAYHRTAA